MKKFFLAVSISAVLFVLSAQSVWAASGVELEPITVTAYRTQVTQSSAASSTDVIDVEDANDAGISTVTGALAKVPGLEKIILCFGRSTRGISFDAVDNRPVHLFVQILSPMGMANEYLHTLARISRILKNEQNRRLLMQATSKEEILELFNASGE